MSRFDRLTIAILTGLLIIALAPVAEARRGKKQPPPASSGVARLVERLPADPLMVMATDVDEMRRSLEGLFELFARFDEAAVDRDEIDAQLASFGEKIGCSLEDELLASLGPALALTLDLPPFDGLPLAFAEPASGVPQAFGGIGLLAELRSPETVERCLQGLIALGGGRSSSVDGLQRVAFGDDSSPPIHVWFALRDGLVAVGFASEFVESSLAGRAAGTRLVDGEDYAAMFRHLDPNPNGATYVNLPKLVRMIDESAMVQGAIASDAEMAGMISLLLDREIIGSGLASTSVRIDGQSRTSTTGPALFGGAPTTSLGIVAAIAIPNFLNAVDRGKQKRTMADLRSIATTLEEYSIDNNVYPRPTDGWEPVSVLAEFVSPIYIRQLPTVDGWGHGILFRCDDRSYRLVSPGKDGVLESDWSGEIEGETTQRFDADIVFGDGAFIRWPEGTQE